MKPILCIALFLCFSLFQSQLKKIELVDFFHWTSSEGVYYEVVVATENISAFDTPLPAMMRVKYSLNGGVTTQIVEFKGTMKWVKDDSDADNVIGYIDAEQTATTVEGGRNYTPDNFILYYKLGGTFQKGYQADHNQMENSEVKYATVFQTQYGTVENLRSLIRLYYKSTDPVYRDMMTYASKYD